MSSRRFHSSGRFQGKGKRKEGVSLAAEESVLAWGEIKKRDDLCFDDRGGKKKEGERPKKTALLKRSKPFEGKGKEICSRRARHSSFPLAKTLEKEGG